MAAVRIVTRAAFGTWALVQAAEIVLVDALLVAVRTDAAARTHVFHGYSMFCTRCGISARDAYLHATRCPSLP